MERKLAIGTAWILSREKAREDGCGRTLEEAFDLERERLKSFIDSSPVPEIFTAHLEMLEDQMLKDTIKRNLCSGMVASDAVAAAAEEISEIFLGMDDEYLQARVDDVLDICQGLIDCLSGVSESSSESLPADAVVVAEELFPSDTAKLDLSKVQAFVTAKGSKTSHVSIIARGRDIPCVTGVDISGIKTGDILLVDGEKGVVTVNPSASEIEEMKLSAPAGSAIPEEVKSAVKESGAKVLANAGSVSDIEAAIRCGADGIGLFRTEFLFLGCDSLPSEDEQYLTYKKAVEACQGHPLTIRTMDIGGDKPIPGLDIPKEDNPFLGLRGVRLSLKMPELFRTQVKAILRAAAHGKVKMMIPMVTRVEEVTAVKALVSDIAAELESEGKEYDKNLEIGIMVETPAAVLLADELAGEVDFFSVGTNDLTQYIMAADRGNTSVSYLYDPLDSAVVKAVGLVVEAAHKRGIQIGVCGEAASEPEAIKVLLGLGTDSLSIGRIALIEDLKG